MELRGVLHEGHALALDGVGDDHGRLALGALGLLQGGVHLAHVVAVDLDDVPAEGAPFGGHVPQGFDVVDGAVELDAVGVDDGADLVQTVGGRGHGRLPDLALLDLPVAEHDVVAGGAPVVPGGHGGAVGQ